MNNIEVYSTNDCPWSVRTRALSESKEISYEEINIESNRKVRSNQTNRRIIMNTFINKKLTSKVFALLTIVLVLALNTWSHNVKANTKDTSETKQVTQYSHTVHKTVTVNGQKIFYREAGPKNAPVILLLHGFPTSSHMFRNLIPELADRYHLIAPDYPGFGNSSQPSMNSFEYTFDNLAVLMEEFLKTLKVKKYSLYLMDYGAPIGFRLAAKYPEQVDALIIQNGNAYKEGLRKFWDPIRTYWNDKTSENAKALAGFIAHDGVKWQYTHGVRNEQNISPDNWYSDLRHLNREGNAEIQLALFYDYQNNVPHYPEWQAYFRKHQPPTLIVWGKNDYIFPADGAHPYKKDLENLEFHLIDTGHFALEEDGELIADYIREFMSKNVN